jgi:hypothetical protein
MRKNAPALRVVLEKGRVDESTPHAACLSTPVIPLCIRSKLRNHTPQAARTNDIVPSVMHKGEPPFHHVSSGVFPQLNTVTELT